MPAIHVIYDPRDVIHTRPEDAKRIGASVVTMRLDKPIGAQRTADIAAQLIALLTAQLKEEGK